MADTYIDILETKIYGRFARDQMAAILIGLVPDLDAAVKFAVVQQETADKAMAEVIARKVQDAPALKPADVTEEARDVILRFGSHLNTLKGRPVDSKAFFRGEAPSVIARRRLTKLSGALAHILDEYPKHKAKIRDADYWQDELTAAHDKVQALEKQQRSIKLDQALLTPDLAAAREKWLVTYNANKDLVRGVLGHAGKPELLQLIFDDLAEVHRAPGVSDEPPPAEDGKKVATAEKKPEAEPKPAPAEAKPAPAEEKPAPTA